MLKPKSIINIDEVSQSQELDDETLSALKTQTRRRPPFQITARRSKTKAKKKYLNKHHTQECYHPNEKEATIANHQHAAPQPYPQQHTEDETI